MLLPNLFVYLLPVVCGVVTHACALPEPEVHMGFSIRHVESRGLSERKVPVDKIVEFTAKLIKAIVASIRHSDLEKERSFTKSWVSQARREHPNLNALCVHGAWRHSFSDYDQFHFEIKLDPAGVRTFGYECFIFNEGGFHRDGDGGYESWAFAGSFERNDRDVQFYKIESSAELAPPPEEPPLILPEPIRTTQDGVYLVNCNKDGIYSSGVAYYSVLKDGGNWGQIPDDYVDVTHGALTSWERSGYVVFPSTGTLFSWSVVSDGQVHLYERAGNADNTYVHFNVYKDSEAELYVRDGWHCNAVYWAF